MKRKIFTPIMSILLSLFLIISCSSPSGGGSSNSEDSGDNSGGTPTSTVKAPSSKGGTLVGKAFVFNTVESGSDYIPAPSSDSPDDSGGDTYTDKTEKIESDRPESIDKEYTYEYLSFYEDNIVVLGTVNRTFKGTEYYDVYQVQSYKNGIPQGDPVNDKVLKKREGSYGDFTSFKPKHKGYYKVANDNEIYFDFRTELTDDKDSSDKIWIGAKKPDFKAYGLNDEFASFKESYYTAKDNYLKLTYMSDDTRRGLNGKTDWTATEVYTWDEIQQNAEMSGPEFYSQIRKALASKKYISYNTSSKKYSYVNFGTDESLKTAAIEMTEDSNGKKYFTEIEVKNESKNPYLTDTNDELAGTDYYFAVTDKNFYYNNTKYDITFTKDDKTEFTLSKSGNKIEFFQGKIYGKHFDPYPTVAYGSFSSKADFIEDKEWCYQEATFISSDDQIISLEYTNEGTYLLVFEDDSCIVKSILPTYFTTEDWNAQITKWNVKWPKGTNGKNIQISNGTKTYNLKFFARPTYETTIKTKDDLKLSYLYASPKENQGLEINSIGKIDHTKNEVVLNLPSNKVAQNLIFNWGVDSSEITLTCGDYSSKPSLYGYRMAVGSSYDFEDINAEYGESTPIDFSTSDKKLTLSSETASGKLTRDYTVKINICTETKNITFDMNSTDPNISAPAVSTYIPGIGAVLPTPNDSWKLTGYELVGWTTTKGDIKTLVTSVDLADKTGDITLYAYLQPKSVKYKVKVHYMVYSSDYNQNIVITSDEKTENDLTGKQLTIADLSSFLPSSAHEFVNPGDTVPYVYKDKEFTQTISAPAIPTINGDGTTVIELWTKKKNSTTTKKYKVYTPDVTVPESAKKTTATPWIFSTNDSENQLDCFVKDFPVGSYTFKDNYFEIDYESDFLQSGEYPHYEIAYFATKTNLIEYQEEILCDKLSENDDDYNPNEVRYKFCEWY